MASLRSVAAGTLLGVSTRKLLFAPFSHSAVSSSVAISTKQFVSPKVPQIFDIFDAPVRLREKTPAERLATSNAPSTLHSMPIVDPSNSESIYRDASSLPSSLPPPVTFDGPARPPGMSQTTLAKRRLRRENSVDIPRIDHAPSAASYSALLLKPEPRPRLFDGPSRAIRYQCPMPRDDGYSFAYISLTLCLSSAFGWLALKDNLDVLNEILTR